MAILPAPTSFRMNSVSRRKWTKEVPAAIRVRIKNNLLDEVYQWRHAPANRRIMDTKIAVRMRQQMACTAESAK
jgi:hypothetical protein